MTIVGIVTKLERLRNTRDGNPVYEVTLSTPSEGWPGEVTLMTAADSSIAGRIDNAEYRDQPHEFTLSRTLRIQSATPSHLTF